MRSHLSDRSRQAVVDGDGTLVRGNGAASSQLLGAAGRYEVLFDRDVTDCAYVATVGDTGESLTTEGSIIVASRTGHANGVFLETKDPGGSLSDRPFHLFVIC